MNIIDRFILTFTDNTEPCIVTEQHGDKYEVVVSQWLYDLTDGKAQFVKKDHDGIEISIPIGLFLELKDNPVFQCHCTKLIRLRISDRSLLSVLCYPINHIDNKIEV